MTINKKCIYLMSWYKWCTHSVRTPEREKVIFSDIIDNKILFLSIGIVKLNHPNLKQMRIHKRTEENIQVLKRITEEDFLKNSQLIQGHITTDFFMKKEYRNKLDKIKITAIEEDDEYKW